MAIALRNTSVASVNASGTLAMPVPTGTISGDVLVYFIVVSGTGGPPVAPSGITALDTASAGPSFGTYYRVCDGTEGATFSFTVGAGAAGSGRSYSGVNGAAPINAHGAPNKVTGTTATATSIATTVNGCELLFGSGAGSNEASFTDPTGFASQAFTHNSTAGVGIVSDDEVQASFGATGSISAAPGWPTSAGNYSSLIALAPLVVAGSPDLGALLAAKVI